MSGRQQFSDLEQNLSSSTLTSAVKAKVENNLSPGPNLSFWMLHRRRPSFPVFSWIWSPWQCTSLSQGVPVRARKAGGHLDMHCVSGPVSHKLKDSGPRLLQECASLLGPILSGHTKMSTGLEFSTFLTFCRPYKQTAIRLDWGDWIPWVEALIAQSMESSPNALLK